MPMPMRIAVERNGIEVVLVVDIPRHLSDVQSELAGLTLAHRIAFVTASAQRALPALICQSSDRADDRATLEHALEVLWGMAGDLRSASALVGELRLRVAKFPEVAPDEDEAEGVAFFAESPLFTSSMR